jgi:hypothetical protein
MTSFIIMVVGNVIELQKRDIEEIQLIAALLAKTHLYILQVYVRKVPHIYVV